MSLVTYVDRRNTDCSKWDAQSENFGEEGLHAMWVADMDFQVPSCVTDALSEYVKEGGIRILYCSRQLLQCFYQLGKRTWL